MMRKHLLARKQDEGIRNGSARFWQSVRVEAIEDPVVKFARQLDKLVDELAKGKPLEKILRK